MCEREISTEQEGSQQTQDEELVPRKGGTSCQKFRLGVDCVGITFVYVPLHSLGGYNVFVA